MIDAAPLRPSTVVTRANVPGLSHLQVLALGVLMGEERSGRDVREQVRGFGVRRSLAAFYQFMARLERDGLVEGWYEQIRVGGQLAKERRYRITPAGRKVWKEARAFYQAIERLAAREGSSNA
jgi:DNA-binding PadR family transcriptional regulator